MPRHGQRRSGSNLWRAWGACSWYAEVGALARWDTCRMDHDLGGGY